MHLSTDVALTRPFHVDLFLRSGPKLVQPRDHCSLLNCRPREPTAELPALRRGSEVTAATLLLSGLPSGTYDFASVSLTLLGPRAPSVCLLPGVAFPRGPCWRRVARAGCPGAGADCPRPVNTGLCRGAVVTVQPALHGAPRPGRALEGGAPVEAGSGRGAARAWPCCTSCF